MASMRVDDNLLVAYADGELDPATAGYIESLMASDAAVRERVAMFRRSSELLRVALADSKYTEIPPRLAEKANHIVKGSRSRRYAWLSLPVAAAFAGFIIGSVNIPSYVGIGKSATEINYVKSVLSDIAEYHAVFAREKEHLVEVPASRKEHLEAWLGNRVEFPLKVPDLSGQGLEFQGGRLLAVNGQPVGQLMYTNAGGERVALCVGLNPTETSTPMQRVDDDGLTLFGKGQGRHVFIVVGPSNNPLLKPIAQKLPELLGRS